MRILSESLKFTSQVFFLCFLFSCTAEINVETFTDADINEVTPSIELTSETAEPVSIIKEPRKIFLGTTSCVVTDKTPDCWGDNSNVEISETSGSVNTPKSLEIDDRNYEQMAIGSSHICGIYNGGLYCWGINNYGQLGNGTLVDSNTPQEIYPEGSNVQIVKSSGSDTCAVVDGGLFCWGRGTSALYGDGTPINSYRNETSPFEIYPMGSGVTSVGVGRFHSCAVLDGGLNCWGQGSNGKLGDGSTSNRTTPVVIYPAFSGITAVEVSVYHTCAVKNEGLFCWGDNYYGQIGDGTNTDRNSPVQVYAENSIVQKVVLSGGSSCILINNGLECWGNNNLAQLGTLDTVNRNTPVEIYAGIDGVVDFSMSSTSCALFSNRDLKCWGYRNTGVKEGGSFTFSSPISVPGLEFGVEKLPDFDLLNDDSTEVNCAVVSGGIKCWGTNSSSGALGNGTTTLSNTAVEVIPSGSNVTEMALISGTNNSAGCAVVDGGVKCWGEKFTTSASGIIAAGSGAIKIAAGQVQSTWESSFCAVVNGGVECWGRNTHGQLGNGTTTASDATPVTAIASGSGATDISIGGASVCAIVDGGVKCWGINYKGTVGLGVPVNPGNSVVSTPFNTIASGSGVTQLEVRGSWDGVVTDTACAVKNGGVFCWGSNLYGQIGTGSNAVDTVVSPTEVFAESSGVTKVRGSLATWCAIKNGGVYCWGTNYNGLLGEQDSEYYGFGMGTPSTVLAPKLIIAEGSGVTDLEITEMSACAIKNEGLLCWGDNSAGQLGDGTVVSRSTPKEILSEGSGVKEVKFLNGFFTTCARVNDSMKCWGESLNSVLGINNIIRDHSTVNGSGY